MPTIEQIRAARALIGWSQGDLAEQADLSQTGIARIENGTNKPNSQTLAKIQAAFDKANVEFIDDNGVKKRTGEIRTLTGQSGFRELHEDLYQTAKQEGGSLYLLNAVPKLVIDALGSDYVEMHKERMKLIRDNYDYKVIVEEGEDIFFGSDYCEYRWMPSDLFVGSSAYIYGHKYAIVNYSDPVNIMLISNKAFTEAQKKIFDAVWQLATKNSPKN